MPTDPQLGALVATAAPAGAFVQRLAALGKRVEAIERQATVQTGSGAPTQATRDGTLYVDVTNSRLYVRTASSWRYAVLT